MAACAIEVTRMAQDTMEQIAERRLDEWNAVMNSGRSPGPAEPSCTLGRVQEQRVAAGSASAPRPVPISVDEVERAIRQFSLRERRLIDAWYSPTPMDIKAKDCHTSRAGFYRSWSRVLRRLYSRLY